MENSFKYKRAFGPPPIYPNVEKYVPKDHFIRVAGPCSVESVEQIEILAKILSRQNIGYLRGGVFRAGTYPNKTRGFGFINEGLIAEFHRIAHDNGMRTVLEVLDYSHDAMAIYDKYGDAYQVGARQMQNYKLLDLLSKKKRTVFIKRNMGATIDEFLGAAEWVLRYNFAEVILVERGSSSYLNHVRWEPSISMIPAIHEISKIPVIIDASHSTGRRDLIEPITLAGVAAGANGYLIETHPEPDKSLSDAEQAVTPNKLIEIDTKVERLRAMLSVPYESDYSCYIYNYK